MSSERHRWVVDSIEESVASVEVDGKRTVQLPKWLLPRGAKAGDVLEITHDLAESGDDSRLSIVVDRGATRAAMDRSAQQVAGKGRSPGDAGGDIQL